MQKPHLGYLTHHQRAVHYRLLDKTFPLRFHAAYRPIGVPVNHYLIWTFYRLANCNFLSFEALLVGDNHLSHCEDSSPFDIPNPPALDNGI